MESVEINIDHSWEKANIDFYNVRFIRMSGGEIITDKTLNANNRKMFFDDVERFVLL